MGEVARVLGVSSWSLYQWSKRYGRAGVVKHNRRPRDRSAQEKLRVVIEFEGLQGEKQGEYLRREGLQSEHIAGWKKSMEAGLEGGGGLDGGQPQRMGGGQEKDQGIGERYFSQGSSVGGDHGAVGAEKKSGLNLGQRENE